VDDSIRVEIVQGANELLGDLLHRLLGQALVVLQNVEQLALCVLRHNAEVSLRFEGVKHQDDVVVVQGAQDADLLSQVLDVLLAFAVLLDHFHGNRESGVLPPCLSFTRLRRRRDQTEKCEQQTL
jgi:hypothetical protein